MLMVYVKVCTHYSMNSFMEKAVKTIGNVDTKTASVLIKIENDKASRVTTTSDAFRGN